MLKSFRRLWTTLEAARVIDSKAWETKINTRACQSPTSVVLLANRPTNNPTSSGSPTAEFYLVSLDVLACRRPQWLRRLPLCTAECASDRGVCSNWTGLASNNLTRGRRPSYATRSLVTRVGVATWLAAAKLGRPVLSRFVCCERTLNCWLNVPVTTCQLL